MGRFSIYLYVRPYNHLYIPSLGYPAWPEAQQARPEAQPARSEAPQARSEAQPAKSQASGLADREGMYGSTYGRMYGRTKNLPILQDLVLYRTKNISKYDNTFEKMIY